MSQPHVALPFCLANRSASHCHIFCWDAWFGRLFFSKEGRTRNSLLLYKAFAAMVTILEGILLWLFTAQLALGFVDTEDLLGDECIEPGNSCAQYAMQLKVLRQTETVEDDCKDLPDLGEGMVQLVSVCFAWLQVL